MKLKLFIAAALVLTTSVYSDAQQRITKFYVSKPKEVKMPVLTDSLNNKGATFNVNNLQRTDINLFADDKEFTLMETDTAGVLKLNKLENKYAFYLVKTSIRADKFSSGNIKVVSPNRWEAFMNGYSMQLKNTAEDSISASSNRDIAFSTEPEQAYELVFKIFVTPEDKMPPYIKAEVDKSNKEDNVQFTIDAELKKRLTIYGTIYNKKVTSVNLSPSG
ncbi:MAG: S9 family peptidase, partial [Bacteroides sp.]|nr:S9 family peptidase [Bacteroides sp.]